MRLSLGRTGRVAQLGERLVRNEEAGGSNPLSSTRFFNNLDGLSELQELPNFGPPLIALGETVWESEGCGHAQAD